MANVNLCPNGSFEHDTGSGQIAPAGWTTTVGATNMNVVPSAFAGSVGSKVAGFGSGSAVAWQYKSDFVRVSPGTAYTVACAWQQGGSNATGWRFLIEWYDSSQALISTVTGAYTGNIGNGSTSTNSLAGTAPANAAYARLVLDHAVADINNGSIDAINFAPTAQGTTYHDGDTAGWGWLAAPGSSPSNDLPQPLPSEAKPPLDLMVEIVTPDGTRYQWGPGSRYPGSRPQGINFATRLGDGFGEGGCNLARLIDRDYVDVNLLDDMNFVGIDGSIAYEGRVSANPRSVGDAGHSMEVDAAGWMAHARDKKAQVTFVDRQLSRWRPSGTQRRISLIAASYGLQDCTVVRDAGGAPALLTSINGAWTATTRGNCDAWYDSPVPIGSVYFAWKINSNISSADTNWSWLMFLDDVDDGASSVTTGSELRAAGPGTGTLTATGTAYFACVRLRYNAGPAGAENTNYDLFWTCMAVYGNHGLTKRGTSDATHAQGFYVSDMIKYLVETFCPELDSSGVEDTTYIVEQAAWLDPTDPFDIVADLNRFHLYQYGVEDNKRFYWRPTDLTDYDWTVDYNDPSVDVKLQGDTVEGGVHNGICVTFQNLANGLKTRITPATAQGSVVGLNSNPATQLVDPDPDNPANRRGIQRWDELELSDPYLPDSAVQIGKVVLASRNQPKGQGTVTIKGHLRDRAGHWQQGWKVRAGQRIVITSSASLSDRPRLISETRWDHESRTLTVTVESPPNTIDAVLDRFGSALSAANLI